MSANMINLILASTLDTLFMVAVAAAIGNAIFDATGVRLRRGPFTDERVKALLASA